jgi:hypothetical protein
MTGSSGEASLSETHTAITSLPRRHPSSTLGA